LNAADILAGIGDSSLLAARIFNADAKIQKRLGTEIGKATKNEGWRKLIKKSPAPKWNRTL
jgi:hypothetical protein